MKEVLSDARRSRENAEQLHNILPDDIKPTTILMNPPFSASAGRMAGTHDATIDIQHIDNH